MAKGRLPEGYRGVDLIIKEFRIKNPKGKVETTPVLLGDGYVIITAKITTDDGAVGSGMADADVQEDKSVEKAESGAIRRALLTLGYESIAFEDEDKKEEPKEEKKESRFGSKGLKRQADEEEDADQEEDEEQEEKKEEKPKSRFGSKRAESNSDKGPGADSVDSDSEDQEAEGKSRFKRGSRFQRN